MKFLEKKYFLFLFGIFLYSFLWGQSNSNFNCFSIAVGKAASADGSVFLAHNEDDSGKRIVNMYKVPHIKHKESANDIVLKNGYIIPQVEETNAYLWLELPELEFSDTYMNEFGVTIASNACKSREDSPEIVNGGIGYWLRRLMAERALTSKQAVLLAGKLIEKIGYVSSGRTYIIADPYEVWMLSVVKGKHWVAQRIPDNQVAIIPNYYTITNVDLSNPSNFLGSPDLIEYAIKRGWYNPETDGDFNFRKAYSDQDNLNNIVNKARHWIAINLLSEKQYDIDDDFPFSFKPSSKVKLKDLFEVLRNHYEGTPLDLSNNYKRGNPHYQKTMSICSASNQYGFVAQLRNWLSTDIGAVMWYSPIRPCVEPFVPIYNGITKLPKGFAIMDYEQALLKHFDGVRDFDQFPFHPHVSFYKKAANINVNYSSYIVDRKKYIDKFEKKLLNEQKKFEDKIQRLLIDNSKESIKKITDYSIKQLDYIVKKVEE